jgi:hypothetical protein
LMEVSMKKTILPEVASHGLTLVVVIMLVTAGCAGIGDSDSTDEPGTDTPNGTDPAPITDPQPTDTQPTDDPGSDTPTPTRTPAGPPPDPPEDRLGWEGGYWYNESVSVDRSDGLNQTELNAVVNRSMARVEQIRKLEFERSVPVNVVSREEFAANTSTEYQNISDRGRLFHLIRGESRFYINESQDPIDILQSTQTGGIGGFYSPSEDRIAVISENTSTPKIDELTLAQELFHALQDQRFTEYVDLLSLDRRAITSEEHNRIDAVVEGDGNYVEYLYKQRCGDDWNCLEPQEQPAGDVPDINVGLQVTSLVPYSDAVGFVQDLHEREGWEAVNALYERPLNSTEPVIHPEKFRQDPPANVTITDTSADSWDVLDRPNDSVWLGLLGTSASNMSFGEGGIFTMLWYPSFQETRAAGAPQDVVIPFRARYNVTASGELSSPDPYNYDHPASAGWDGDKLVPYVTDGSAETNETGYVWKTAWDSEADASAFMSAYKELLTYYGGENVNGQENAYRIPEGKNSFADAFYVNQDGDTVIIVNAPTVDDLGNIHAPAGG